MTGPEMFRKMRIMNYVFYDRCNLGLVSGVSLAKFGSFQVFALLGLYFKVATRLKSPGIFDGRNLYNPKLVRGLGIEYLAIGR